MLENRPEALWLSRDQSRRIDAAAMNELGLPGLILMENAARGVCDVMLSEMPDRRRILIVCGPGNNGGDGVALARQLAAAAVLSDVVLLDTDKSPTDDFSANAAIWTAAGMSLPTESAGAIQRRLECLESADVVVDCLLGTGVRGAPRSPYAEVIESINACRAATLSVDVPSGLDCDTGEASGDCVRADRTVTFVGMKRGFAAPAARPFLGHVSVAHIGIPWPWLKQWYDRHSGGDEEDRAAEQRSSN